MNGSERTVTFGFWKSLLFLSIIAAAVFTGLELALWAAGVESVIQREDPSRGFSGLVSAFEREDRVYRTRSFGETSPFNDQSFLVDKPENGLRLFTLGGSSAYGHPWGAHAAFTAILGEVLGSAHPELMVEAINAAGVSYAIHRLGFVADEIMGYSPDILILYAGHNEFAEPTFFAELKRRSPERNRVELLAAHSRIHAVLRDLLVHPPDEGASPEARFDMFVRRNESHAYDSAQKREVAERYRAELGRIVRLAHERGVKVVLATLPANLARWRPNHSIVEGSLDEEARSAWAMALESGRRLVDSGAFAAAAAELERAVAIAPRHAESHFLLGQAYEGMKRWESALDHYRLAADHDASPIRRTSELNRAVKEVAAEEDALLVDAEAIFERESPHGLIGFELIDDYVHPTMEGHRMLAWHLWNAIEDAGWLDLGASARREVFNGVVARRAAEAEAPRPAWLYNQGFLLAHQGLTARAIAKFREAVALAPSFEPALANLAQLLVSEGEFEQAREVLDRLLRQYPENVRGRVALGALLSHSGRDDEALAEFRRAVAASPDAAFAHQHLGAQLLKLQKPREAREAFSRAVAIDPNHVESKLGGARALAMAGDTAAAVGEYRAILAAHSSSWEAHHELGLLLSREGREEEAVRLLSIAVALAPRSTASLLALGMIQLRAREYEDAKRQFEAALGIDPESAEAHAHLGRSMSLTGHARDAVEHYRQAIRLRPDWPTPYNNLAWILATHPDSGSRDPKEAIALATEAVRLLDAPSASALDTLAAAQAAAGEFQLAAGTAGQALELALAAGAEEQAGEIKKRMELFERREPYRAAQESRARDEH